MCFITIFILFIWYNTLYMWYEYSFLKKENIYIVRYKRPSYIVNHLLAVRKVSEKIPPSLQGEFSKKSYRF